MLSKFNFMTDYFHFFLVYLLFTSQYSRGCWVSVLNLTYEGDRTTLKSWNYHENDQQILDNFLDPPMILKGAFQFNFLLRVICQYKHKKHLDLPYEKENNRVILSDSL